MKSARWNGAAGLGQKAAVVHYVPLLRCYSREHWERHANASQRCGAPVAPNKNLWYSIAICSRRRQAELSFNHGPSTNLCSHHSPASARAKASHEHRPIAFAGNRTSWSVPGSFANLTPIGWQMALQAKRTWPKMRMYRRPGFPNSLSLADSIDSTGSLG